MKSGYEVAATNLFDRGLAMTIPTVANIIARMDTWVLWFSVGVLVASIAGVVLWHLVGRLLRKLKRHRVRRQAPEPRPWGTSQEGTDSSAIRGRRARQLLARAKEEYFGGQNVASCLACCTTLDREFPDLPEAAEARQLRAKIRSDPERLRQACALLADSLAELYLELAESCLQQGDPVQAAAVLQRLLQNGADSRHAQTARDRLSRLSESQLAPQAGSYATSSNEPVA